MENITINNLMKVLNKEIKIFFPFHKEWKVYSQKGGVGCYDTNKWAVFIPENMNIGTKGKVHTIIHEGAHLILREKLSRKITPNNFDNLKWCMEPFVISNSVFTLDEVFAELVARNIMNSLPENILHKKIIFDKFSEPSYEDHKKRLHLFLAKISEWKVPITLKNNNMNISNILNNLTLLEPKKRIKIIIDAFSNLKNENYKNFICSILKNPLKYDPCLRLTNKIVKLKIKKIFYEFDEQILLDYFETLSWVNYTEKYWSFDEFVSTSNKITPKMNQITLSNMRYNNLIRISDELSKIRKEIIKAWEKREKIRLLKLVQKYNSLRLAYREKIVFGTNFNKFGFGRFR